MGLRGIIVQLLGKVSERNREVCCHLMFFPMNYDRCSPLGDLLLKVYKNLLIQLSACFWLFDKNRKEGASLSFPADFFDSFFHDPQKMVVLYNMLFSFPGSSMCLFCCISL